MKSYKYSGALVTIHGGADVLCANVCGFIGESAAEAIVRDSVLWNSGRPVLAQVVNYSQALVQIDHEALYRSVGRGLGASRPTPTAIVFGPESAVIFAEYARQCAIAGIPKAAFRTFEEAHRWAIQQAAVRADWLELRHRISSSQSASNTASAARLGPRE